MNEVRWLYSIRAVSYTHLDVYKRQVPIVSIYINLCVCVCARARLSFQQSLCPFYYKQQFFVFFLACVPKLSCQLKRICLKMILLGKCEDRRMPKKL